MKLIKPKTENINYKWRKVFFRVVGFLFLMVCLLKGLSWIACKTAQENDPVYTCLGRNLIYEKTNTIDVVTVGTSDSYSAVSPLEWWNDYGYTGYTWGQASARFVEEYSYLQTIYQYQSPKVVFLEMNTIFSEKSDFKNLEYMVRSYMGQVFPVFYEHRFLSMPERWKNIRSESRSLTKGYWLRSQQAGYEGSSGYMEHNKSTEMHPLAEWQLKRCVKLCEAHGSKLVLLNIPSPGSWSQGRHDKIQELADEFGVDYIDLNVELEDTINWKKDTADQGTHLNFRGAKKVSAYLGEYLKKHCKLKNHSKQKRYARVWNADWKIYDKEFKKVKAEANAEYKLEHQKKAKQLFSVEQEEE